MLTALGILALTSAQTPNPDVRATLLAGVKEIASPGIPGAITVTGDRAHVILTAREGRTRTPVVAASDWGAGRVVAFAHNGYWSAAGVRDTGRLFANAIAWAGRDRRVLATWRLPNLAQAMRARGLTVVEVAEVTALDPARHVLAADAHSAAIEPSAIRNFVTQGGGLMVAATPWGWKQGNPDRPYRDFRGNQWLRGSGLGFTDGLVDADGENLIRVNPAEPEHTHAGRALAALTTGPVAQPAQASAAVMGAAVAVAGSDDPFAVRLNQLVASRANSIRVSAEQPLGPSQPLERVVLTLLIRQVMDGPTATSVALPGSDRFPGPVPPTALLPNHKVELPAGFTGWHSTGLYAAPGRPITVTIPAEWAQRGLRLRIGAHTDTLYHLDAWRRAPEVSRSIAIQATETTLASPFGGLIYIEGDLRRAGSALNLTVKNAAQAPRYVRGRTTPEQWRALRQAPGPWAEIEGNAVINTFPSAWIRNLDDPERIAAYWDRMTDLCAELVGGPAPRTKKERMVADVQISAGYMHAGYPIMTHDDIRKELLDPDHMVKTGSWGHFHEMGHNHQSDLWTFDGTVEVTVNLFTLYVYDKMLGFRPADRTFRGEDNLRRWRDFVAKNYDHNRWKEDPFMALTMYMQMQEAFGWETFQRVFREYAALPANQRPQSQQDRRDQWMIRMSRATGRNLAPFMTKWKLPLTDQARQQVANLPVWMPAGME